MQKLVWLAIIVFGFLLGLSVGAYTASVNTVLPPLPSTASTSPSSPMLSPAPTFTLLAVGDVMLGRSVNLRTRAQADYTWPFHQVASVLKSADLTFANLENPIIKDCPPHEGGFKFCSPPESILGLTAAGIDVVSLANNHATNYGSEGLAETVTLLEESGIVAVGAKKSANFELSGTTLELFAYNDIGRYQGINPADQALITTQLASSSAKLKIVSFHWGEEYTAIPSSRQVELAHLTIEAGADLILGHHPHWVQTEEIYLGKPIFYSLGNFVFDQMWSEETKQGLAIRLTYQDTNLLDVVHLPVYIENFGQPKWYSELSKPKEDS